MWAQLITVQLKSGKGEADLSALLRKLRATEQPGSGLVRSTTLRDRKDPSRVRMLVIFDSEEAARAREQDPRRQEGLADVRSMMGEIFDGAPAFDDMTVIEDFIN